MTKFDINPPLLRKRMEEFKIPPLDAWPPGDKVVLWRLDMEDEKTAGGLYVPDVAKDTISHRAVLVGAGLEALDWLASRCVELGHIVHFGRYAGDDQIAKKRAAGKGSNSAVSFLVLAVADISRSEDLMENLRKKDVFIEVEDGIHYFNDGETHPRPDKESN